MRRLAGLSLACRRGVAPLCRDWAAGIDCGGHAWQGPPYAAEGVAPLLQRIEQALAMRQAAHELAGLLGQQEAEALGLPQVCPLSTAAALALGGSGHGCVGVSMSALSWCRASKMVWCHASAGVCPADNSAAHARQQPHRSCLAGGCGRVRAAHQAHRAARGSQAERDAWCVPSSGFSVAAPACLSNVQQLCCHALTLCGLGTHAGGCASLKCTIDKLDPNDVTLAVQ